MFAFFVIFSSLSFTYMIKFDLNYFFSNINMYIYIYCDLQTFELRKLKSCPGKYVNFSEVCVPWITRIEVMFQELFTFFENKKTNVQKISEYLFSHSMIAETAENNNNGSLLTTTDWLTTIYKV